MAAEAVAGTAWVEELARLELRAQYVAGAGPSPAAPVLTVAEEERLRELRERFDALPDDEREIAGRDKAEARAAEGRRIAEAEAQAPRRDPGRDAADLSRFIGLRGLGLGLTHAEQQREEECLASFTLEEQEQYAEAVEAAKEVRRRRLLRARALLELRAVGRRGDAERLRGPVRRHDGRRAPRRASVRSSPRQTRAPGRSSEGEPSPAERVGVRRPSSARAV